MKKILLLGGGGHAKVVISIIRESNEYIIKGIVDKEENIGKKILGIPILYTDSELPSLRKKIDYAFVSVGSVGNPNLRIRLFNILNDLDYNIPYIISKYTIIKENVKIGKGSIIMPGVIVEPDVKIGENCIINTGAVIEHDCIIGDHVHIAPGVTLSGSVRVGRASHVGTGASIVQGIRIGENSIIGAGAVVVKDTPDNVKAYGVPARKVEDV